MTLDEFLEEWNNGDDCITVHTSGSTGKPKPLRVEKCRMEASAHITCRFLGLKQGDTALLCMPLDYIAGKMVVVRSIVAGLRLISVKPGGHPLRGLDQSPVFAAMVPLQVYDSISNPEERRLLMGVRQLIIGGGAVDDALCDALKDFPNAVWSTYGMTETLSHIALRRLNGPEASEWYTPFENVSVATDADGCLMIDAPAVCEKRLKTNDIAELDADGRRFRIIGRKDNVVCSGGIKMQIEEMERQLKPHATCRFMITKVKDHRLGEAVAMLVEGDDSETMRRLCEEHLPKYSRPKHYICVSELPMTATGKPARAEAMKTAQAAIGGE